jgi:hypothetical protein
MYRRNPLLLLLLLLLTLGYAQEWNQYSPCASTGSCCFVVDWSSTPGIQGTRLNASYVLPRNGGPFGPGSLGLSIQPDASMTRPGAPPGWAYPLGFLNTSNISSTAAWKDLQTTDQGLLLTTMNTDGTPYVGDQILHVRFERPACLSSMVVMRSYSWQQREGFSVALFDANEQQIGDNRSYAWSPPLRFNLQELDYGTSGVSHMVISWHGLGYGGISFLEACVPDSHFDRCGVCGGNGSQCSADAGGPQPGDSCFNVSQPNPVCRDGVLNQQQQCVPRQLNVNQDVCGSVDQNCDGVVTAPEYNISCGVGECARTYFFCGDSGPQFNSSFVCTPGAPTPEICDGLDNNCNGLIDEGNVCAHPVEGVGVVPTTRCVEGRTSSFATQCYAHFGYYSLDPVFTTLMPYLGELNQLSTLPTSNTSDITVPQVFAPNASVADAFRVPIPCTGAAIWTLADGRGHSLSAVVYASSAPPCESDLAQQQASQPISVFVESVCAVSRDGICQTQFGYFNPGHAVFLPVGPTNQFLSPTLNTTTPPSAFFPQRVRSAVQVSWPCPLGIETLTWNLTSAGVSRLAVASPICINQ